MKAIFAGSFNPFTQGHYEIVKSAAGMFPSVVVAVARDTMRAIAPDASIRYEIAKKSVEDLQNVEVKVFSGMLTEFMKQQSCLHLVRGLRDANDFIYEQTLSSVYQSQNPEIVPVYFFSSSAFRHVSGTVVRSLIELDGNLDGYVVKSAQDLAKKYYRNQP